jgi:hypothetical protein
MDTVTDYDDADTQDTTAITTTTPNTTLPAILRKAVGFQMRCQDVLNALSQ